MIDFILPLIGVIIIAAIAAHKIPSKETIKLKEYINALASACRRNNIIGLSNNTFESGGISSPALHEGEYIIPVSKLLESKLWHRDNGVPRPAAINPCAADDLVKALTRSLKDAGMTLSDIKKLPND